ncbi:hypothetical protein [Chryseobacterium sp.]|uniref:hypothetical protein n=1 Tax=Chryseobacterium sp. TaxID=1871047 RepID=UPI0023F1301C|nr:hypothetical protein [Chryseobacterium sp.]
MNLNFSPAKIDEAIRKNSKRSSMILDLANTSSYTSDGKLFYGREFKNRIEVTRIKTLFSKVLPTLIIVFKKNDFQNPNLRLSFFGYIWFSILLFIFLFAFIKKNYRSGLSRRSCISCTFNSLFLLIIWDRILSH